MNAEIIAVGSELLLGQIVNTNARYLSLKLAEMGIDVFYHTVVGDNPARLKSALEIAEKRSQIIILTGGLGPTKDDLTKETLAKHLGKALIPDEEVLDSIRDWFNRTGRIMTENNRKQALVFEGSQVLPNDHGMAPGMILTKDQHLYMLLPGPPVEMEPMFSNYGLPALASQLKSDAKIVSRVLHFFGIGEASLVTEIDDLIDAQSNPTIAPLASDGEVTLRLTAKHTDLKAANSLLDQTEKQILQRVGQYFYGYDNTSLFQELVQLLKARKLTIAAAESLTGGMFQAGITAIPGASSVLKGGVVCYTTEVKHQVLGVKKDTIETYGVVSEQCARELAENVAKLTNADIGISFTGVAGPDEQEGKPVGTVYVGIAIKGMPVAGHKLSLSGTRQAIRVKTVKSGCHLLLKTYLC